MDKDFLDIFVGKNVLIMKIVVQNFLTINQSTKEYQYVDIIFSNNLSPNEGSYEFNVKKYCTRKQL
jgi:hypothetical protein